MACFCVRYIVFHLSGGTLQSDVLSGWTNADKSWCYDVKLSVESRTSNLHFFGKASSVPMIFHASCAFVQRVTSLEICANVTAIG